MASRKSKDYLPWDPAQYSVPKSSLRGVALKIRKANEAFVKRVGKSLKGAALVMAQECIEHTAVDTGETRSNWRAAFGRNVSAIRPPFHPYPKETDPFKFFESANANMAMDEVREFVNAVPDLDIVRGREIFIVNASPIAAALNDGTILSKQEPPGFIENAEVAASDFLRTQRDFK